MVIVFGIPVVLFVIGYILAVKLTIAWQLGVTVCGLIYFMSTVRSDSQQGFTGMLSIGVSFFWFVVPTLVGAVVGNMTYYVAHGVFNGGIEAIQTMKWLVTP